MIRNGRRGVPEGLVDGLDDTLTACWAITVPTPRPDTIPPHGNEITIATSPDCWSTEPRAAAWVNIIHAILRQGQLAKYNHTQSPCNAMLCECYNVDA